MKFQLIFIILLCFTARTFGVPASSAVDFHSITTTEGLPGNGIGAIKKDLSGFIWIGTNLGICRFDGCEVKTYSALEGENIWSLEELDADTLLVGTAFGLKYFSRKTNTTTDLNMISATVKAIMKIDGHRFLVGTEAGLYIVDNHIPRQILLETKLSSCNHITSIVCENKDVYWFSTVDGLGRIDIRTMKSIVYRMPEGLDNTNHFTCLTRIDSVIYLGSFNKGIFRFNETDGQFNKVDGFEHNLIMTIYGEAGHLFVGTNGQGLKVMSLADGGIRTYLHKKKQKTSLNSNTVISFLYDKNILWVGTQFGGLNYTPLDKARFSNFHWNDFYSTDYRVRCCYIFPNGDKLIGTRTGLFFLSEKRGLLRNYNIEQQESGLRSDIILFINKIQNRLLVSAYGGGMHVFDEKTLQLKDLSNEEPFLYGCFYHFMQDRRGDLWLASQDGLYQSTIDGHVLKKYDTKNSPLTTNIVFYVYADESDRLWIGTKDGLYLMDINTGKLNTDCFGTPIKGTVRYIMEDSKKNFWVCTFNGLYKLGRDLQVEEHFTTDNLLPDNQVSGIIEDKKGSYWIIMSKEVVEYSPMESVCHIYRQRDGLTGQDFNNNVVMSADSTLWLTSEGGLIYTSVKGKREKHKSALLPVITSYSVAGSEYDYPYMGSLQDIVLQKSENSISFKFSTLDYSLPYANVYEYKLEGYDKDWIEQSGINEVVYKDLPSGRYVFLLRVLGADNGQERRLTVVVNRSYTFLALSVCIFALIIGLVVYFSRRIWKLKKRMTDERRILSTVQEQGKTKKTLLPDEKINDLLEDLLTYMEHEKPYLNAKLSVGDVAAWLGCTEPELSQLLNSHMNVNFANFINIYRVNEIKSRLNQENLSKYTLNALSEQCGFSSKPTFYRVFKNVTGMTPLEYCKKQNLKVEVN
ncbi:helix-turn-helix domain-containing protein [uncultured Bacteroides sp.]|uniref:helix-turn-helix domain-containing protein n=1 Tax=uncultured Bacteroides sp. TaxID=162156 RepID=UPI0025F71C24|nr:helix-turn-helix domain-containing protein [uncultured Bacteroides sp.]